MGYEKDEVIEMSELKPELKCLVCNEKLNGSRRKFCSEKCSKISRRKEKLTHCAVCNVELIGDAMKYCSKECKASAKAQKAEQEKQEKQPISKRVCACCAKEYDDVTRYKYCSHECKRVVQRERERNQRALKPKVIKEKKPAEPHKCLDCDEMIESAKKKRCEKCAKVRELFLTREVQRKKREDEDYIKEQRDKARERYNKKLISEGIRNEEGKRYCSKCLKEGKNTLVEGRKRVCDECRKVRVSKKKDIEIPNVLENPAENVMEQVEGL